MPRVLPVGQDENGVRLSGLQTEGRGFLSGSVVGACLAQRTQSGGVTAGLRGEMAPEAEHVRPGPQAAVRVERVEPLAGFDQATGVVGDVVAVELGKFTDAAVQGAGGLGGFGGVLGDVGGDGLW